MSPTPLVRHDAVVHQRPLETGETLSSSPSEETVEGDPEQAPPAAPKVVDVPPDGGYGWVVVACCFLINGHTWGVNSSFGVFLAHYLATNTYPGATPFEFAFIGGLSISMCQAVSPIATVCVRRYGTRTTMAVGIFFETAALLGASWSTEIWQLFLSQGVAFGWGMGFLFISSVGLCPQWFSKRRSFANSIATSGSGFGGLLYSLAINAMIGSVGLEWAFRILAIVTFVVNGICAILIRDRNVAIGSVQEAFALRLLKRPEFLLLVGWGFFSLIGYVILLFSLPNYGTSIELTAQQGAVVGSLLNLGQGIGRPFIGYFSDAAGRMNIALLGTFITAFFCFVIWIFAKTYAVLLFFALIVGVFAGTYWTTISVISAEVVGLQLLPSALSLIWISLIIPSTFAEPIGLQLKTQTGNIYLHAQIFTAFMYIAAALCLWFLRAWKISELEMEAGSKDDDEAPHEPDLFRTRSVTASVKSKAKATKNLWAWRRV